jgi:hypothetical protein
MNADAFRHFYEYHFTQNREIWDSYISDCSKAGKSVVKWLWGSLATAPQPTHKTMDKLYAIEATFTRS